MQVENNPNSDMLKELKQTHDQAKAAAKGGGGESVVEAEELPEGASPIQARTEASVDEETTTEETSETTEGDASESTEDEGEPIRIGGQTFKSQKEAIEYAERIERERELTEAHAAGIREALEATRGPAQPDPEPEDDFEQRFYANPKETLKELKTQATNEALAIIKAEAQREGMWTQFLTQYPDVRRKDAERVLQENWDTIGKMTDVPKAMKVLAGKVRAEYEEIINLTKPRTVLADKKQVVSPSGGQPKGVTPAKKEEAPLGLAAQMRVAFKR